MIFVTDIFSHPENLSDMKNTAKLLDYQIKMVEGLEHAKNRLSNTTTLDTNTLKKCDVFIQQVNKANLDSDFSLEVSKLSLNELLFASIAFEARRLVRIVDLFKASDIRTYVKKQNIVCLQRREIFSRIRYALRGDKGGRFSNIYDAALEANKVDIDMHEEPEPTTAARASDAFPLLGTSREDFNNVFIEHIANSAHLWTVESRYSREKSGDVFVSFDLESDGGPLAALFNTFISRDNPVAGIPEVFGQTIANAIDRCDYRNWEKRNGCLNTTDCVKIKTIYRVKLRICDDPTIANILHSRPS